MRDGRWSARRNDRRIVGRNDRRVVGRNDKREEEIADIVEGEMTVVGAS